MTTCQQRDGHLSITLNHDAASSVNVSSLTTCQQRDGHLSITLNYDTACSVNVSSLTTCQRRRRPVNHTQSRRRLLRQRLQLDDLSAKTDTCQSHSSHSFPYEDPPPPTRPLDNETNGRPREPCTCCLMNHVNSGNRNIKCNIKCYFVSVTCSISSLNASVNLHQCSVRRLKNFR